MPKLFTNRSFIFFLLAAVVFALYSFMLQNEFKTLDDESSIVQSVLIKDFRNAGQIMRTSYFGTNDYYRPLVLLTYMAEYHFFGLNAMGYYVDNILIHIITAFFVFLVFDSLFRRRALAFAASFLYAIHPVHWEAVSNISGRAILLCTLFTVAALWFFMTRKSRPWFYALAILFFALALLCKEAAGVFPLVILSYQFFLGRGPAERLRQWLVPVLPFFLLLIPYVVARKLLGITELFYARDSGEAFLGFVTFLRATIMYVRVFFLPFDLHFDRSLRFLPGVINFDMLLIVALYGLAGWFLFRYRRQITPLAWFLLSWSAIELAPVSQVLVSIGIQPGHISAAEHFIYASAIGFAGLVVLAADWLSQENNRRKIFTERFLAAGAICFAGYLMLTLVENNIYSSREISMLERTIAHDPWNGRIRLSLALAYAKARRFEEAEKSFRRALQIDPLMNVRAQIGLGKSLCDQGKFWECLEAYDAIPDPMKLKDIWEENRRLTLAILQKQYMDLLAQEPDNAAYIYALGVVRAKSGESARARQDFLRSVELKPDFREAWFNLAASYAAANEWPPAVDAYKKVLQLSSGDDQLEYQANLFLARIYKTLGELAKADYREREAGRILGIIEKDK